jgi:hypothetical protein
MPKNNWSAEMLLFATVTLKSRPIIRSFCCRETQALADGHDVRRFRAFGRAARRKFVDSAAARNCDQQRTSLSYWFFRYPLRIYNDWYSAVTVPAVPPRTLNSPITVILRGFNASTRSSRIVLTTAS